MLRMNLSSKLTNDDALIVVNQSLGICFLIALLSNLLMLN